MAVFDTARFALARRNYKTASKVRSDIRKGAPNTMEREAVMTAGFSVANLLDVVDYRQEDREAARWALFELLTRYMPEDEIPTIALALFGMWREQTLNEFDDVAEWIAAVNVAMRKATEKKDAPRK